MDTKDYKIECVKGHVEVYLGGVFLFSADDEREALQEISKMEEQI